ncbi:MAG: 4-alpha-glucanotransferase [Desulfobacterales bacterium]|nr:4-alpha-glucanotransferase [Desulfobacterales bacterium]
MKRRGSGVLLHISSLPSPFGIGDLGPWAYRFADFLAETKQGFWQILPLNPAEPAYANSPYHATSVFAGNPLLISPELLVRDGFLAEEDIKPSPNFPEERVNYEEVVAYKKRLFSLAYEHFKKGGGNHEYERFCQDNSNWLIDFALFLTLKAHFNGKMWSEWPSEIRDRKREALQPFKEKLLDKMEFHKFLQYLFFKQWLSLKLYCNHKGIHIIGDIPFYVEYDSVELWTNPDIFKLDGEKRPYAVAGVPPDYFSETGQLWGNPVYRWDVLRERDYNWWVQRIGHNLRLFDLVRIDHFRGFVGYWEVPAGESTAMNGRWVEAPAQNLFNTLLRKFPYLPMIAEDLGFITPDVREIINRFDFLSMKVLLFAFGNDLPTNPYIPHNIVKNCVIYTGTHDNNTVRGWFEKEATSEDKRRLFQYLGHEVSVEDIHWEMIRLAMMSVANMTIFPMQDILGLGETSRMNRPATTQGNWLWRLLPEQLTQDIVTKLSEITEIYGRG